MNGQVCVQSTNIVHFCPTLCLLMLCEWTYNLDRLLCVCVCWYNVLIVHIEPTNACVAQNDVLTMHLPTAALAVRIFLFLKWHFTRCFSLQRVETWIRYVNWVRFDRDTTIWACEHVNLKRRAIIEAFTHFHPFIVKTIVLVESSDHFWSLSTNPFTSSPLLNYGDISIMFPFRPYLVAIAILFLNWIDWSTLAFFSLRLI